MKLNVEEFVNRVRARFPRDTELADAWLAERGWEPQESPYIWVEAFADGSSAVETLVDVSYAENLMWDLAQPEKVQAWPHINLAIRQQYEQMWGAPSGR
jgi:hypothetical protein